MYFGCNLAVGSVVTLFNTLATLYSTSCLILSEVASDNCGDVTTFSGKSVCEKQNELRRKGEELYKKLQNVGREEMRLLHEIQQVEELYQEALFMGEQLEMFCQALYDITSTLKLMEIEFTNNDTNVNEIDSVGFIRIYNQAMNLADWEPKEMNRVEFGIALGTSLAWFLTSVIPRVIRDLHGLKMNPSNQYISFHFNE